MTRLFKLLGIVSFLFCFPAISTGQNVLATWNKGEDGFWWTNPNQLSGIESDWDMAGNILPYTFPATAITGTGFTFFDVEILDGSNVIVPSGLPISISNLTMSEDSSIELIDGTDFLLLNAGDNPVNGIVDGGEIRMTNVGTGFSTALFLDGNITFRGGGKITMSGDSNVIRANTAFNANGRMTLEDYTIEGSGNLGFDELLITIGPDAMIDANASSPLTIDPLDGASSVFNTGILQASNGGTLRLFDGGFDNTNGVIQALGTGVVETGNVTIRNGVLGGDGTIRLFGPTLLVGPITNNGNLEIDHGHTATIDGDFINNSTIRLADHSGRLLIARDMELTGGGTIHMSDHTANLISANGGSQARLTNVDNLIRGSGSLGGAAMRFTNMAGGIIRADQSTPLFFQPQDAGNTVNMGVMEAVNGGTLTINIVTVQNQGGLIRADQGTLQLTNSASVIGGTVQLLNGSLLEMANGTLDGVFNNSSGSVLRTTFGINNLLSGAVNNPDGGTIAVGHGSRLTLNQLGSYNNQGTIALEGTGPLSGPGGTRIFVDGHVLLQGGGDVHMSNSASNTIESAVGNTGLLTNVDHRIHGAGHIGRNTLRIVNHATIEADMPFQNSESNGTIFIDPGGGTDGFINHGMVRASNGGQITLMNGVYQNQAGVLEAGHDSALELQNAVEIQGGTIRSIGSGEVRVTGQVTLDGIGMNLDAQTIVAGPIARLNLWGDISNRQSILLEQSNLHIRDTVVLDGGGTIQLSDDNVSGIRVFSSSASDFLINEDNTITGSGSIQSVGMLNRGTIRATGQNNLVYSIPGNGFDNQGQLHVEGPGELHLIGGPFTNSGNVTIDSGTRLFRDGNYVQTAGTTKVNGTLEVSFNRQIDILGGKLGGNGEIIGAVNIAGTVGAGNSVGILNFGNSTVISGTVQAELASALVDGIIADANRVNTGTDPTMMGFDQINVFDMLTLDDVTIDVSFLDAYAPRAGDFFDIITADQLDLEGDLIIRSGYRFDVASLTLFDGVTGGQRDVLRLTAVAVPEPGSWLAGLTLGLLLVSRRGQRTTRS